MFPNFNTNPTLFDPNVGTIAPFAQTQETMIDTELYSHFINNVELQFRKSKFYREYKSSIYALGFDYDQMMRGLTAEMANQELHHHLPTLRDAAICITEYCLKRYNAVTTFDVARLLEECHRENIMGVIVLSATNHQNFHNDPSAFISVTQLIGNPFKFIDSFGRYAPMGILYAWSLQLKLENQNQCTTTWPLIAKARDEIRDWSSSGNIRF